MDHREEIFAREGRSFPGATYRDIVLEPIYGNARGRLLPALLAANRAHVIMLAERGLIPQRDADILMHAMAGLDEEEIRSSSFTGEFEDLFFYVEGLISRAAGDAAGNLHLARSRNDLGEAMYRLALREALLRAKASLLELQDALLSVASEHVWTVMPAHTHTQPAQPTTLAHYLAAVYDSLGRDGRRLLAAYENCNLSPLGAAAITGSGFDVDRGRLADLLAFDGVVENTYDAIAGADFLGEAATALGLAFVGLGRFVADLLLWSTREFGALRVADPYVQVSSIMPQKRNPVSLEHARSLLSAGLGDTNAVLTMLHNTPFGDIVDTEDDLQPYLWRATDAADGLLRLLAVVVGTAEVNQEVLLRRAEQGYSMVTELADTMVRERGLTFKDAHAITSATVKLAESEGVGAEGISPDLVDRAARGVVGESLELDADVLRRALDPMHFVETRSLPGGPAPQEMKRALAERRAALDGARSLHHKRVAKVQDRLRELDETANLWALRA